MCNVAKDETMKVRKKHDVREEVVLASLALQLYRMQFDISDLKASERSMKDECNNMVFDVQILGPA